jgi:hypothetical protein
LDIQGVLSTHLKGMNKPELNDILQDSHDLAFLEDAEFHGEEADYRMDYDKSLANLVVHVPTTLEDQ